MSDFWLYVQLGFDHVLDINGYDHVLFIAALSGAFSFGQWRKLLLVVTLFTIGHTLSLLLAHYDLVSIGGKYVEFLIPITILIAALHNLRIAKLERDYNKQLLFIIGTFFFGMIHGFGFARYYAMIQTEDSVAPLLEFAVGVELAQIVVVIVTLGLCFIAHRFFGFSRKEWGIMLASIVIGGVIPLLVKTWPF